MTDTSAQSAGHTPTRYRARQFEIEATQWHTPADCRGVVVADPRVTCAAIDQHNFYAVHGKQGWSLVDPGDWIITEMDGSGYYPCKPDVFAAKYETAEAVNSHEANTALIAELVKALTVARVALEAMIGEIEKLPQDIFGTDSSGDAEVPNGLISWPLRDEFLYHLKGDAEQVTAALAKASASNSEDR